MNFKGLAMDSFEKPMQDFLLQSSTKDHSSKLLSFEKTAFCVCILVIDQRQTDGQH